jgi:hypothetical protein
MQCTPKHTRQSAPSTKFPRKPRPMEQETEKYTPHELGQIVQTIVASTNHAALNNNHMVAKVGR